MPDTPPLEPPSPSYLPEPMLFYRDPMMGWVLTPDNALAVATRLGGSVVFSQERPGAIKMVKNAAGTVLPFGYPVTPEGRALNDEWKRSDTNLIPLDQPVEVQGQLFTHGELVPALSSALWALAEVRAHNGDAYRALEAENRRLEADNARLITRIRQLEEVSALAEGIRNAWNIVGVAPGWHRKSQESLIKEWPTLGTAVQALVNANNETGN